MFSISNDITSVFNKLVLTDQTSNTRVEVLADNGAILHAFIVNTINGPLNIIEQYETENDLKQNFESLGFKSAKLSPFVCRLKNAGYQYLGQQYTIDKFVLNGHALHGLLYNAAFVVDEKYVGEDCARVKLIHAYRGEAKGYPFRYDCVVTYELKKGNHLRIATQIINNDAGTIPISDGWHPYFTLGEKVDNLLLQMKTVAKLEFDDELIPTGNLNPFTDFAVPTKIGATNFDNCFTCNFSSPQPMAVITGNANKISVEIHPEKNYPFLQVYIPPHRNSIAIENLSSAPDALNNNMGLDFIPMGSQMEFVTHYIVNLHNK